MSIPWPDATTTVATWLPQFKYNQKINTITIGTLRLCGTRPIRILVTSIALLAFCDLGIRNPVSMNHNKRCVVCFFVVVNDLCYICIQIVQQTFVRLAHLNSAFHPKIVIEFIAFVIVSTTSADLSLQFLCI